MELADRLRNPLAAIEGYIEVRDQIGDSAVVDKIAEHAGRIERMLDELRARELITYRTKRGCSSLEVAIPTQGIYSQLLPL